MFFGVEILMKKKNSMKSWKCFQQNEKYTPVLHVERMQVEAWEYHSNERQSSAAVSMKEYSPFLSRKYFDVKCLILMVKDEIKLVSLWTRLVIENIFSNNTFIFKTHR